MASAKIENRIADCFDGRGDPLSTAAVWYLVIHRLGAELGDDAAVIARAFRNTTPDGAGYGTGGRMPYHFLVFPDGRVAQCLPLDRAGAHAMKWNSKSIGIACLGDFRLHPMPSVQESSLIDLCSMLRLLVAGVQMIGHTDLPESSTDVLKVCPGKEINLSLLRAKTAARTIALSADLIARSGVQLHS